MQNEYPKLRADLEAFPIDHAGKRMLLLRDRTGFSKEQLVFAPEATVLLMQMNGANSLRDLQTAYLRATGDILYIEDLREFVQKLDEHLFLENERFLSCVARERDAYLDDPVRRTSHAGRSYPADPEELKAQLRSFFSVEKGGPGPAQKRGQSGRRLAAIVAPHIDLQGGGPCFAHAYRAVLDSDCPGTWIVLGTGHEYVKNCFALTAKDFETPLGLVRCDAGLCEELVRCAPADIRASEYNHKTEHVIEFQAVFLAFTRPEAKIVPLLCSFPPEDWGATKEYVDSFAALLRRLVEERAGSCGIIASVDLAHVGPRYGDPIRPGAATVQEHMGQDRKLLECLERCDAEGFMRIIEGERNRRRVCGVAPLYLMAKILEGKARGEVLSHSYAGVDDRNSFVTFASMAFYEKDES